MPLPKSRKRHSGDPEDSGDPCYPCDRGGPALTPTAVCAELQDDADACNDMSDEEGGFRFDDIYIPPAPRPACTFDCTGPRLIVSSIENYNFKSYAGKQVLGPFHKCFNAIMGPNGSGKSNVIDSLLFVFGYRASKLRSKKISVLLHNSDKHKNVQSCTVTVNFIQIIDKGDDFEAVQGSEIVISRTAFKDNTSFYTLNGKRVQFKAVAKLLRSHAVDLDFNRFLILQGEVEQIAMMKPKAATEHDVGMLEYLEEIIGTARYKEPIEKLNIRLEELVLERSEKVNRMKYAEQEKNRLEGPKNEAIRYLKIENDIARKRSVLMQITMLEYNREIEQLNSKQSILEAEHEQLQLHMTKVQKERNALDDEMLKVTRECAKVSEKRDKVTETLAERNARDVNLQETIGMLDQNRQKTQKMLDDERTKLITLENIPTKSEKEMKDLTKQEEELSKKREKERKKVEDVMVQIRKDMQEHQEKKEKLQTGLLSLQKDVDDTKSAFDIAQSTLLLYTNNEDKEKNKLEEMKTHLESVSTLVAKHKKILQELKMKIPETTKVLKTVEKELEAACTQHMKVSEELRTARIKLEETRAAMNARHSQSRVVDALMKEKKAGRLPGIFGRLGDLGAIDKKYDVAVSTACSRLDNIVVDTVDTGQQCIEFLKMNNIGRTSIIVLEKQEHLWEFCKAPFTPPKTSERLFDLIHVEDERVCTAFYFALRDTLVSKNLKEASDVAYGKKRYRVVTLDGQIIEPSGTMSGGGQSRRCGGMGQQVLVTASPQSKNNLEERVAKLNGTLNTLQQHRTQLERKVEALSSEINAMNVQLNKSNAELKTVEGQEPVLRQQLKLQEVKVKEVQADPARVRQLTIKRDKANEAFIKAAAKAEKVDTKVKEVHDLIVEITGQRTKAARKMLDDLTKQIEKTQKDRTKLTVSLKSNKRNCDKSKEKIFNMENDLKEACERLTKLEEEKKAGMEETKNLKKELETVLTSIADYEKMIKKLNERLKDEMQVGVNEKRMLSEKEHEIDSNLRTLQTVKCHLRAAQAKKNACKLHSIPGELPPADIPDLDPAELGSIVKDALNYDICVLESTLSQKKPNMAVVEEYREKEQLYITRVTELEEVTNRRNQARSILEDVRRKRLTDFMDGYSIITNKLKEMYQTITLGGDAEFELVDSLDPFSEGIIFSVRPPKKSWKNISNLSGGEKTLASLALVFALHYYKPSPLYIMDEIDAALDFRNVSVVGNYIKERTKNAQFVVISLRANMFELADRLVGIYKTYDCTKSVTVNPGVYKTT